MNPLYNTNDSPNQATNPGAPQNDVKVHSPRNHNVFTLNRSLFTTHQYGYIYPFYRQQCVPDDVIPFSSRHEIRAFTMQSPFMGNISMHKDFFCVPKQSILPNTWELIYRAPALGDDVPDDAICTITGSKLTSFLNQCFNVLLNAQMALTPQNQKVYWNALLSLELFCSSGSLLYNLGYKINPWIGPGDAAPSTVKVISFDTFFDYFCNDLLFNGMRFSVRYDYGSNTQVIQFNVVDSEPERRLSQVEYNIHKQTAVCLLRDYLPNVAFLSTATTPGTLIMKDASEYSIDLAFLSNFEDVNIDYVLAYQIAVSQFFVNTKVDYIYDCTVYRENFYSLFNRLFGSKSWFTVPWHQFSYNGSQIKYDYFSNHYLDHLFDLVELGVPNYGILSYLFGYRNSLRYEDYFVGARTRPYAPGAMDSPVVDNKVSAIDVTKSIVAQRFRNAVVKVGNSFGDYLRKIMHKDPSPDYHFPKYMTHQDFGVSGFETANTTSDNQGTLVTTLKTDADKYVFQAEIDMPCILIGLCSYSVPRVYCQTKDRFFSHVNRFDMFNPMLQFIGDQSVMQLERNGTSGATGNSEAFGYQSRNAEYKQTYSTAAGGFVEALPSWAFICDTDFQASVVPDGLDVQSADYIRSRAYEFDRFFSGFSGFSLGHKFHFIVKFDNMSDALRPMEVNPSIL